MFKLLIHIPPIINIFVRLLIKENYYFAHPLSKNFFLRWDKRRMRRFLPIEVNHFCRSAAKQYSSPKQFETLWELPYQLTNNLNMKSATWCLVTEEVLYSEPPFFFCIQNTNTDTKHVLYSHTCEWDVTSINSCHEISGHNQSNKQMGFTWTRIWIYMQKRQNNIILTWIIPSQVWM